MSADHLRGAVVHTRQKLNTSERRTCTVIGLARSTMQYRSVDRDNDDALRLSLIRLAKQYGRYGCRKITQLLRIEGWQVNHKKVERLWREEGLQLPKRHKKRKRLYHKNSSVIRLRPTHQNHIWSIDFVHDKLSNGRAYKMLTVIDEYRVRICAPVTYLQSLQLIQQSYILMVIDAPAKENIFLPSKLVDYIGAKKPIIALSPRGSTYNIVKQYEGFCASPDDVDDIAETLKQIITGTVNCKDFSNDINHNIRDSFKVERIGETLASYLDDIVVRKDL